jgi:hypothetical protein
LRPLSAHTTAAGKSVGKANQKKYRLEGSALQSFFGGGGRKGAIYDLIDGVNRFSFTRAATQNKNTGYQLEAGVSGILLTLRFTILPKNNAGDTHGFPTMPAKDSSKLGGFRNSGHQKAP